MTDIKVIEGLESWEVMRQHMEKGKMVAVKVDSCSPWEVILSPRFNWHTRTYAIIDDTAPDIDWNRFDWGFFSKNHGLLLEWEGDKLARFDVSPLSLGHTGGFSLCETPFYTWFGGECPVPGNVEVEIVMRDGTKTTITAALWMWPHGVEDSSDTIAFRLTGKVL